MPLSPPKTSLDGVCAARKVIKKASSGANYCTKKRTSDGNAGNIGRENTNLQTKGTPFPCVSGDW